MAVTTAIPMKPINIKANGIQKADKTHHQDHVITFRSFNVINTIVNNPKNPIPVLLAI